MFMNFIFCIRGVENSCPNPFNPENLLLESGVFYSIGALYDYLYLGYSPLCSWTYSYDC